MQIEHWNPVIDGEYSETKLRAKLESRGFSVNRYVYPPGTVFPEHDHTVDKIDAVVSGRFKIIMHGREFVLQAGDCLSVPRGVPHSAQVIGNEAVTSLDAVKL